MLLVAKAHAHDGNYKPSTSCVKYAAGASLTSLLSHLLLSSSQVSSKMLWLYHIVKRVAERKVKDSESRMSQKSYTKWKDPKMHVAVEIESNKINLDARLKIFVDHGRASGGCDLFALQEARWLCCWVRVRIPAHHHLLP